MPTLLDIMIICDGNIDTPYDCQQCMDVAIIRYLWGSSCKAKKKLLQRYEGTCIPFLYHFIKLKKSRLLILEKSSAGDKKCKTFWQGASLNFH